MCVLYLLVYPVLYNHITSILFYFNGKSNKSTDDYTNSIRRTWNKYAIFNDFNSCCYKYTNMAVIYRHVQVIIRYVSDITTYFY